ncbi:MAG: site-specific integrase [Candidatus Kuenenia sp.]|nr:site-specific integrase [Candidatus Kuenenia sp.]
MAAQEQVISTNPMQGFKRLKTDETSKRVLTDEEIREILNESALPIGWERTAILFGLFTGIRLMDVMSLKWSSIDFNGSTITLVQQKTGRTISLPLSSYLVTELKKYKATVCNGKEYLFHDGEVNHKKQVRFSNHFIKVFRGLGLANISFHNLRHTHASRMVEITKDVSLASGMLGHASLNTTMTYIHKGAAARKEAIENFTNHMLAFSRYVPDAELKTA